MFHLCKEEFQKPGGQVLRGIEEVERVIWPDSLEVMEVGWNKHTAESKESAAPTPTNLGMRFSASHVLQASSPVAHPHKAQPQTIQTPAEFSSPDTPTLS